jgi:hypothetical protein
MLSQPLPPPFLPNPMTIQGNGASIISCNTSRTKNYAAPSALLVAVTAPSDLLPPRLGSIASSAAPSYLGDMKNQLLLLGGDTNALQHSSSDQQQQQNTAGTQAMYLSNPSLAAFLSNACSGGVNTSSSQIGLTGEQNDFSSHSFHPHGGIQSIQQASTLPDDHHQTRRDRLLLQLLMEKHNSNSTDI